MNKEEAKFMAYDWDGGEYILLPSNDIVEAIYTAWNYEFDVFEVETYTMIFSGGQNNDANSEWLEPYGLRLIDSGNRRKLQNIYSGEIYEDNYKKGLY